ncbi:MAG TPA: DUF222 domain-containing protein, partial [Trebonia sp.]|nr:DUF222 domain-containing protein [Trebonia sp.]
DAATAAGVPVHCRPGQFPGEELAAELLLGPVAAAHAIDAAADLTTRLPRTLAGMAAGLIDADRAGVIALYTRSLPRSDAALADDVLAAVAPTLRLDQLAGKAAALERKLNPEGVKARREHARRTRQRVEIRLEESGNASVAGREMDTRDALASKAHIHALALRLRRAGLPGTLDQLRLSVFADLTSGRDPLNRIPRPAAPQPASPVSPHPEHPVPARPGAAHPGRPVPTWPGAAHPERPAPSRPDPARRERPVPAWPGAAHPERPAPSRPDLSPARSDRDDDQYAPAPSDTHSGTADCDGSDPVHHRRPASLDYGYDEDGADEASADEGRGGGAPGQHPAVPVPALINLVVHDGTLFGWDTTPTEAGGWGLLDGDETRDIVAAASRHPATRWCVTVVGPDGTATAHGCSPGRHPWPPPGYRDNHGNDSGNDTHRTHDHQDGAEPPHPPAPGRDSRSAISRIGPRAPDAGQAAELAAFLRGLNVTPVPVARGSCDHATAEPRYTPSRRLTHLVRARTATCDAPGCAAQAVHADLDHTVPYPDGPTDQCNLGPKCRRHHKAKQAPGWRVEQSAPGVIRWTLPSGRTHTTRPTAYDV